VNPEPFSDILDLDMDSVTLTIDGRPITVEKGKTVLQAAIEHDISVPYYCYHPGIGIDGSCRVCVVNIEKMPKLQTSCSSVCTDGMVVHTRTPDVIEARAGIFEFLLKRCGLTAAQSVFIDDNASNIEAARALGIHTVWFKSAGQCELELEEILASE